MNSLRNELGRISAKVSAAFTSSTHRVSSSSKTDKHDGDDLSRSFSTKFLSLLTPFEEYFVSIQSILIWEKPYVTAIFIIAINCLYWLIVSWTRRFFSIVFSFYLLTSIYQCWSFYVWPEIRARPPEPDEGWVTVHPKVLSAPEITHYINEMVTIGGEIINWFWQLRKNQPGLFCSLFSFIFSIMAVIGSIVPGVVIMYIILMTVAIGPGIALHVVPESWYQTIRSLLSSTIKSSPSKSSSQPSPSLSQSPSPPLSAQPSPSHNPQISRSSTHEDLMSISGLEGKEHERKSSEGYVGCSQFEDSFEYDKDESSLQLLSDSQLEATLDFQLRSRPSCESSSSSISNNSSLQLVPSMQFTEGAETGDELKDYEIISDTDLT